jgi:hypothetical protein
MAKTAASAVGFDYIHPDKLRFDPSNPRFAKAGTPLGQDEIQLLLEGEPHFALELIPSFLENGFIDYEPLVVRSEGTHYVVVEGNRRLAAIRHILAKRSEYEQLSDKVGDLESIPVLLFPKAPSVQREKEQRVYLGVRHLFGFREWPPESKARYLDGQVRTEADLDRLARELNIKRQDIQRYLVPYRLRNAAGTLWRKHKDQDFWVLGEGLNRAGIKAYIALDVDRGTLKVRKFNKKKLVYLLKFIYGSPQKDRTDRVVKETRQLSALARILQDTKATKALERGSSLAEATVLLESPDESRRRLQELLKECKALLTRFRAEPDSARMLEAFESFAKSARQYLRDGR